jgi:hypothetical protein
MRMPSPLLKILHSKEKINITEMTIFVNDYIQEKPNDAYEAAHYYVVCGCVAFYIFNKQFKLIDTVYLTAGQLYSFDKTAESILIESLDSFTIDSKLLKITTI